MANILANLFAKNPLSGVCEQMDRVVICAEGLLPLIDALIANDQEEVRKQAKHISQLERAADDQKNEVRSHIPPRLFLPVARRDLLRLIAHIDSMADSTEDVGVLLSLRAMEVPEPMKAPLRLYAEKAVASAYAARDLVKQIDGLLAAGFKGRAASRAKESIVALSLQEHETDKLQDQLAKLVFQMEKELSPVAIMMWMKILREIGDIANHAENVGDQFRLFIAK
ncbi:MAG: TIGR00153 family protein [Myxococcales bacterium]|nr:TIGR00153 family protein [Myxococcales bacterium]